MACKGLRPDMVLNLSSRIVNGFETDLINAAVYCEGQQHNVLE
jgi:hypothetical protein